MLARWAQELKGLKIILASQSPRRQEILRNNLGLDFEVILSGFAEDVDKTLCSGPEDYVSRTSRLKAVAVAEKVAAENSAADIIVSADTIVALRDRILEKPESKEHAVQMLAELSGNEHCVHTAVTLAVRSSVKEDISALGYGLSGMFSYKTFVTSTTVKFATLDPVTIDGYVESGEPMDKAGSYGIQGIGSSLVEGISGCYFNVVGFPIRDFAVELDRLLEYSYYHECKN